MALGTSLSNILELNLNENFNKEIKVLAASIQSKKTQFTRFLGAEDMSTEGLLLSRVDLWIKSVTNYPVLNKSQSQVIKELLSKIVIEAMSLKNSLCQAYFNLTQKISTIDAPADKEALISVAISESNKGANSVLERLERWFDLVRIKLGDIKQIVEVDDFLESSVTYKEQVEATQIELPESQPSSVCADSPGVTHPTGKFTLLTPSPGPLDWGCNPSVLLDWFQKWRDYWAVNWVGGTADELQLLKLIKVNLPEEWIMALSEFDWENQTVQELYEYMDIQLNVYWPPLKRTINLMTSLRKTQHETHLQYMDRVKKAMKTGGVGTRLSFSLTWDKLMIVLIMKGLSTADQNDILRKFDTLEVSFDNLSLFMQTLSAVSENSMSHVNSIISKRQKHAPNIAKSKLKTASVVDGYCTRCNSNRQNHLNAVTASNKCDMPFCTKCYQFFHTKNNCTGGFVNVVQEDVSSVSKSKAEPSPRVNGHVTQNNIYKGILPTLLDSGSVVDIMPSSLADSMKLDTHPVSPDKYNLKSASGSPIIISAETSFVFALSSDSSLVLSVLISDSLANQELILSWRSMIALGLLKLPIPGSPSLSPSLSSSVSSNQVSLFSVLSVDNKASPAFKALPRSNIEFLNKLPPMREFPSIDSSERDWHRLVEKQGLVIRKSLIEDYPLAFSDSLGETTNFADVTPVKISVNPGAKPVCKTTCPRVPAGLEKSSKALILKLIKEGVIRRWDKPSDWCAPARFLPKRDGSPRLVVNFRGLNSCSKRVGYPFSSSRDVHLDIQNKTYVFVSLDLIQAYFQLKVAEESVPLLVFLCPYGKMAMQRLPMGWTGSGDYLHITTRCLLAGLDRSVNIFDDLLLQPQSGSEAYRVAAQVLIQAIGKNLKFSLSKFQIAPCLTFCGLNLKANPDGNVDIKPDQSRVEKILNLPIPNSKGEVQSLLGLLGTLTLWFPKLSITTEPIRALIRKDVQFQWTPEHLQCLKTIKQTLERLLTLSPFVPKRPSYIFTDASRQGLGFVLMQTERDKWHFIRCSSSTLTPAQQCYSSYNLELLAIVFALKSLHSFVSSGLKFTILTDCKALDQIEKVDINTIESNRSLRAIERILSHNIIVAHISSHHNKVADYLSRNASGKPYMPDVPKFISPVVTDASINLIYEGKVLDLQLNYIASSGNSDIGYVALADFVKEGNTNEDIQHPSPIFEYKPYLRKFSILDMPSGSLIIFNGIRVVIPKDLRSGMLSSLHKFHFSEQAMIQAACNSIWWPGINYQIRSKYTNCTICMQLRKINAPSTPVSEGNTDVQLMDILSCDWASLGSSHFLIFVEKVSSFIWAKSYSHMSTNNSLNMLEEIMVVHGRPKLIITDLGPSFRGEFTRKLTELHIDHCTTPAYMPSKNGRSERAVALIKKIINLNPPKSTKNLQELVQAVNSRPSGVPGGGTSYERFYGRTPLLHLPQLPHKLSQQQQDDMNRKMELHREKYRNKYKNTNATVYDINEEVLVFDPKAKLFSKRGHIHSFDPPPEDSLGPRNYRVQFEDGNIRKVNCQWLIKAPSEETDPE